MRQITAAFQDVLDKRRRRPAYKLYAWDPATITISQLCASPGNLHSSIPPPMDLTPYASEISWTHDQINFTMIDPRSLFHPDTGHYRNYLGDKAILRLVEGDETLEEADWVATFTGQIHGQVGWKTNRNTGEVLSKVTVFGRGNNQSFKRRRITSREYSVGTDLGIALSDITSTFMGLTPSEMRIPFTLGRQFMHKTNQLSQVSPWDAINSLLEVVCYIPYFDGEGKLSYINKSLNRPMDRIIANYIPCIELEVPESSQDGINKIRVIFLDASLSRVDGPLQKLGTAQVTTGFFTRKEVLPCFWSDDRKQRASGTYMQVIKSVNSNLLRIGSERYSQDGEYHGDITVTVSIWVAILGTAMLVIYVIAAFIPDLVIVILLAGITIPLGRIIQAIAMIGILIIMMSLGSAQYEVWGTPYDYAYLEKTSITMEDGLQYWEENEKEIKNDFIGTHDQADTIALTELIWEKSQSKPRRIMIEDDPSLEVGDIIGIPDGRKILINGMSKRIKRGEVTGTVIDGCKVMTP